MLDFACSNTISTQTNNIYLNQLQSYGQFAELYMLLDVLSLEIYPNVTNSFPSQSHMSSLTLPPLTTPSLEHLPPQANECKTLAYEAPISYYLSVLICVTI